MKSSYYDFIIVSKYLFITYCVRWNVIILLLDTRKFTEVKFKRMKFLIFYFKSQGTEW